jgi:hypothetical protein
MGVIISAAADMLETLGGKVTEGALGSLVGNFLAPITRILEIGMNMMVPTAIAPAGTVIDAMYRGYLGRQDFMASIRAHGITPEQALEDRRATLVDHTWWAAIEAGRPRLDMTTTARLRLGRAVTDNYWIDIARHNGVLDGETQGYILDSISPPDPAAVLTQYRLDLATPAQLAYAFKFSGTAEPNRREAIAHQSAVIAYADVSAWSDRGTLSRARAAAHLSAGAYRHPADIAAGAVSGLPLVERDDIVYLARSGASPEGMAQSDLLAEYPVSWGTWIAGLSGSHPVSDGMPVASSGGAVTTDQISWAAGWVPVDPQTMARYRSITLAVDAGWLPPDGIPWLPVTNEGVKRSLRQAAVHPAWRDSFVVASYSLLGVRELVQIAEHLQTLGPADYLQRALLDGYSPSDAQLYAQGIAARVLDYVRPWLHAEAVRPGSNLATEAATATGYGGAIAAAVQPLLAALGFADNDISRIAAAEVDRRTLGQMLAVPTAADRETDNGPIRLAAELVGQWVHGGLPMQSLTEQLTGYGYTVESISWMATIASQSLVTQYWRERYMETQAQHRTAVARLLSANETAYRAGLLTDQQLSSAMLQAGYDYAAAQVLLASIKVEVEVQWAKTEIALIERQYSAGVLTAAGSLARMSAIGVTASAAQRYISEWTSRQSPGHHQTSAQQILGWVGQGLMPQSVAQQRLTALGWTGTDAHLALASAEGKLAKSEAASARAATMARQKQVKALAKINGQLQSQIEKNQASIKKAVSLGTLKKWLTKGVVGLPYAIEWFQLAGYTPVNAGQYLTDWGYGDRVTDYLPGIADSLRSLASNVETVAAPAVAASAKAATDSRIGEQSQPPNTVADERQQPASPEA